MKRLLLSLLLLARLDSVVAADTATVAPTVEGTWRWQFRMPDGTEVQPKLKLKQEGGRITGTSSHRGGPDIGITNGVFDGSKVRFDVVRERNGIVATTHYEATLEGNHLKGTVESDWNWSGERQRYPFEARRAAGIEGRWKWKALFREREFDVSVTFKLEDDKLTGTMPGFGGGGGGRGPRDTQIKDASFKDGIVKFTVERGRGDFRSVQNFEGKLEADTIKGKIEAEVNGEDTETDWEAKRAD